MQCVYRFPLDSKFGVWAPPPASGGHKGRYLWTDAFGVCNFITLFQETSNSHYLGLATDLVRAVHDTLGRTRDGIARLQNASDAAPLLGGLRIGKESASGQDADGQYHHYLTIWMFALNRLSLSKQDRSYNDLAIQLAKAIHPHFVYNRQSARPRMYWKMSVDLSYPLVHGEGNLDPIDGFVIFRLLQMSDGPNSQVLKDEIEDYRKIVETKWRSYSSQDPLDLGMTLWTAHWFGTGEEREEWSFGLLKAAERDTRELADSRYFSHSIWSRLAFREFGTCLGLQAALDLDDKWKSKLVQEIIQTWEENGILRVAENDEIREDVMEDLKPITLVMYAAALNSGGKY